MPALFPAVHTTTERKVLHSWKDISIYSGRGIRTIQRYEVQLGFPIHRTAGKPRTAVLAFSDEIDGWFGKSRTRGEPAQPAVPKLTEELIKSQRRFLAVAANAKRTRESAKATYESCLQTAKCVEAMIHKLKSRQAAAGKKSA